MASDVPSDEQLVWELHVALSSAPGSDSFYPSSADHGRDVREYTEVREGELAFNLILATATPDLPDDLRERTYEVARRLAPDESAADVWAYVEGWLAWSFGSGVQPPCWT